ncbi:MAG: hypothetical protein ABIU54_03000 [Candidatus Eisenbacteria bacterium]
MTSQLTGGLIAVGVVVLIGLLMRMANKPDDFHKAPAPQDPRPGETAARDERSGDDSELSPDDEAMLDELSEPFADDEVAAVTSDNDALVPDHHAVRLIPPDESGESWKPGRAASDSRGELGLARSWHAGDLTGGRVVRGAADEGPWRFEALGRDGEYMALIFETEDGAQAASAVFESRHIISYRENEDGERMPPQPDQFEEARRVFFETMAALEMPDDDEEPHA